MAFRFSKAINIGKYLRLNVSKSGISANVGKRGASVTFGKNGTYLNLSPSIVGIKGTGLSFREKIGGSILPKKKNTKTSKVEKKEVKKIEAKTSSSSLIKNDTNKIEDKKNEINENQLIIDNYLLQLEENCNIHKYSGRVVDEKDFNDYVDSLEEKEIKELLTKYLKGDEESIESLIQEFLAYLDLDLSYDATCNYELDSQTLYVDLDLPEIESLNKEYPTINNRNEIVYKKKTQTELKEEYAYTVCSLPIFLSANFFNTSPYIKNITISGYSQRRDSNGDLVNQYLYSIKFTRDLFEETDFETIDNPYDFIIKFENRINITSTYTMKTIKPYEMILEDKQKSNEALADAIEALKALGNKASEVKAILPELEKFEFDNSSDYIKQGLKLLKK